VSVVISLFCSACMYAAKAAAFMTCSSHDCAASVTSMLKPIWRKKDAVFVINFISDLLGFVIDIPYLVIRQVAHSGAPMASVD